jgi:hypothetical protein
MQPTSPEPDAAALREALGYLNFSSGAGDTRFVRHLDGLFRQLPAGQPQPWRELGRRLKAAAQALRGTSEAFSDLTQAEAVLAIAFDRLPAAYRQHHRDLLAHQADAELFGPLFLARACEAVLGQGGPWDEPERIVAGAIAQLNDYIGYRPVAVLRTAQKIEPYEHEWVRPVPLYIRGAGAGATPYEELINEALAILETTDAELCEQAYFDLELLDELALDPRAYDFDHPVNKRPNYHFGQWDPHHIDGQGRYRRFVLQGVTLGPLLERIESDASLPREELLFEAGAVLAGTILMGSGVSGRGPDTHDSTVTLATLLPQIASYRDVFYRRLLERLAGPRGERLRSEAEKRQQPFAGVRQYLNQRLARMRARQLQHAHLAELFAQMGNGPASARQAQVIPVASTRMTCEIDGRLIAAHQSIEQGDLAAAARRLPEVEDLLQRAIGCGALVDPWNILGFSGQFSLFPAVENSVHDHRVDQLISLLQRIFALYGRLHSEMAAKGQTELLEAASAGLERLAAWWDKFATLEVGGVQSISGREVYESATHVAKALGAWHRAGAEAGNIAFWRRHVAEFNSPKAYALVVEALLDQGDQVASMALLMQWLSQAEQVPLEEEGHSFGQLAIRWLTQLTRSGIRQNAAGVAPPADESGILANSATEAWALARRFFDYLEANADEYWQVPRFELGVEWTREGRGRPADPDLETEDQDEDLGEVFEAAYEDVTFRDSAADGFEGEMLEGGSPPTEYELDLEQSRLSKRLSFLGVVAELFRIAAGTFAVRDRSGIRQNSDPGSGTRESSAGLSGDPAEFSRIPPQERASALSAWLEQAVAHQRGLAALLAAVHHHHIPTPRGTYDSMVEYDRRRMVKDALIERIIATSIAVFDAARAIHAALPRNGALQAEGWEAEALDVQRAMFQGDIPRVCERFPGLLVALSQQPLLYVALARGGDPQRIVETRKLQQVLRDLLRGLPRLGLVAETCQLIEAAQRMEREHPVGPGAVTEFDRIFEIGFKAIVESLVDAADHWDRTDPRASPEDSDAELIECLYAATEPLLKRWLSHSRSLRLSVLEKVSDEDAWKRLRQFIQRYGADLFTQMFLNMGNLRAILHQGADAWLASIEEQGSEERFALLDALDSEIPRDEAVAQFELILDAVVDNYAEYLDYNTTTTQSDDGTLLYTLLDFLRLKASYERTSWNLRPVVMAHEVLVRRGRTAAAEQWRRDVAERTAQTAQGHLKRMQELSRKYGMRLATVADRLGERFVQPLDIDRLKALVRPAVEELRSQRPTTSFELLEQEIEEFCQTPTGVGIDVPGWLVALEHELEQVQSDAMHPEWSILPPARTPLTLEQIQHQLRQWDEAS